MNFLNLIFYIFIIVYLIIYYIVPSRFRYIVIAIGSYIFYGYSDPRILLILVLITVITYIGGLTLNRKNRGVNTSFSFA